MLHEEHDQIHRDDLAQAVRKTPKPKGSRIDKIRFVVEHRQCCRIEGVLVDLFSASTITQIYDALNDVNKAKFAALPVPRMAQVAFQLATKCGQ